MHAEEIDMQENNDIEPTMVYIWIEKIYPVLHEFAGILTMNFTVAKVADAVLESLSPIEAETEFKKLLTKSGIFEGETNADDDDEKEEQEPDPKLFVLIQHIISGSNANNFDFNRVKLPLIESCLKKIINLQEGTEPDEIYLSYCRVLRSTLAHIDQHHLQSVEISILSQLLTISLPKWYRLVLEGKPLMLLIQSGSELIKKYPPKNSELNQKFLQLVTDLLADEDLSDARNYLLLALQNLAFAYTQNQSIPFILPPPTPPPTNLNETFAGNK